jgi:hypothetical protein
MKQQLLVISRSRRRAPNLSAVLPENSNHTVSRRQRFVLMMQATDRQINLLLSSDIIYHTIDFSLFLTDANIDESCNRTHYGSNWVVYVGKSILTIYNRLLMMINTRITP